MTQQPEFDPTRSASIRAMLSDTAREGAPRAAAAKRRHRTVLITSIAAVAVLAVAGGGLAYALRPASTGGDGPQAGTVPTATHTPAPGASADPGQTTPPGEVEPAGPTSTPAPVVNDPADPSTWVITYTSVGPLKIGVDQASQVPLLSAYSAEPDPGTCPARFYERDGSPTLIVTHGVTTDVSVITVTYNSTDIPASEVAQLRKTTPRTASGIGIASTYDDLKATFPGMEKVGTTYAGTLYVINDGSDRYLQFDVDKNGLVIAITLNPEKDVYYSEYCG